MVKRGFNDMVTGVPPALSIEQIQEVLRGLQTTVVEARMAEAAKTLADGKAFLEENALKEGVEVLPSGLQYTILEEGSGASPTRTDRVVVNYRGTFVDGTQFASSYDTGQPATLEVGQVIPGFQEGLQLMKLGSKWKLFIPPDIAYGERGRQGVPPNSTLIYEIELLEIEGQATEPDALEPEAVEPE
jgi:FKBP-type peptidyl-prolyl cis-trans isomerase